MDALASIWINGALIFPNLFLNLFFLYCLIFSGSSHKFKQPLKFLLLTMIFCSVVFLVSLITNATLYILSDNWFARMSVLSLADLLLYTSMTTSVWINVFYCTQIVPAKHAFFIWVKKNIKSVTFSLWAIERVWISADASFLSLSYFPLLLNSTVKRETPGYENAMNFFTAYTWCVTSYFLLSLGVMILSSVTVSSYLMRHVQSLLASGQSYSSPKFQGQLRVSVTGILQGFLYMYCVLWVLSGFIYQEVNNYYIDPDFHYTVINVYMLGTTLNMWVGQTVFRQRTLALFRALRRRKWEE